MTLNFSQSKSYGGCKRTRTNFSFSWVLFSANSSPLLAFWASWNKRDKVWKKANSFSQLRSRSRNRFRCKSSLMSLNRGAIHDNQVARRGGLGTTVNSEDARKNCSHIHHFHIHHNATFFCITMAMVMQNLGGGGRGGGWVEQGALLSMWKWWMAILFFICHLATVALVFVSRTKT